MQNVTSIASEFQIKPESTGYSPFKITSTELPENSMSVQSIDWEKLPLVRHLKWHEITKTRNAVVSIFRTIGVLSAGAMLFSATLLVASANSIIVATASFGFVSTSFLVSSFYFGRKKTSKWDPDFRKQKRLELKYTIENKISIVTYSHLSAKEKEKVISKEEVQELLRQDLTLLSFKEFTDKHGSIENCFFNENNRALLKTQYINFVTKSANDGIRSILNAAPAKFLDLTVDDLAPSFISNEIYYIFNNNKTYGEFIARNGFKMITYIPEEISANYLVLKFQEWVLETMKGKGDIQAKKEFKDDFEAFKSMSFAADSKAYGENIELSILTNVVNNAFSNQITGNFNYQKLRTDISEEQYKHIIKTNMYIYIEMKQAFLRMPYKDMVKYKNDMELLGIPQNDIKEVLTLKWNFLSIQDILKNDAENFFLSLNDKIFNPVEYTFKVISDTFNAGLSLQQVLQLDKRLVTSEILCAETILTDGKSLSEVLENELEQYQSFEKMLNDYTATIFDSRLCLLNSPEITRLVLDFVLKHSNNFLHASHTNETHACVDVIEKYGLLPIQNYNLLQEAKKKIKVLEQNFIIKNEETRSIYKKQIQDKITTTQRSIQQVEINVQLNHLCELAADASNKRMSMAQKSHNEKAKVKQIQLEVEKLKKEIKTAGSEITLAQCKINELQKDQSNDPIEFARRIQQKSDLISQLKIQQEACLSTDKSYNQDKEFIANFEKQINSKFTELNLQKEHEEIVEKFDKLSIELANSSSEKLALEKKIQDHKKNVVETKGLINALSTFSNSLKSDERNLEHIKSKEIELEELRLKKNSSTSTSTSSKILLDEISTMKTQLLDCNKILKQKKQAIMNKFDLQNQEYELSKMNQKLASIKSVKEKISAFEVKISQLHSTQSTKRECLQDSEKKLSIANSNLEIVKKQTDQSEADYYKIENSRVTANTNYLSLKQSFEKELDEFKIRIEDTCEKALRIANQMHVNDLRRVDENFRIAHTSL